MVKRLISFCALIFVVMFYSSAFALSDAEFQKLKKDPDFAAADKKLNRVYKEVQASMSKSEFEKVKRGQLQWINSERDKEVKKLLSEGNFSKAEAYTTVTLDRARKLYGEIPCDLGLVNPEDFIGKYEADNYLSLSIWKADGKKKTLCVSVYEPRRNGADMFGWPRGNVIEVEFDYDDTDLMQILKYEAGEEGEEDLDLSAKVTMLGKNKLKIEASPDLERIFSASGIYYREYE